MLNSLITIDTVLLILRIGTGSILFINHGIEKLFAFNQMLEVFPDPMGIGKLPSLIFTLIADAVCSLLIILGFFTRVSSSVLFLNLAIAFVTVHKANMTEAHGELIILYVLILFAVFLYGSGKHSLDELLFTKKTFR